MPKEFVGDVPNHCSSETEMKVTNVDKIATIVI